MVFAEAIHLPFVLEQFSGRFDACNSSILDKGLCRFCNQSNTVIAQMGSTIDSHSPTHAVTEHNEAGDSKVAKDRREVVFCFGSHEIQCQFIGMSL